MISQWLLERRQGVEQCDGQIEAFVRGVTTGEISDAQIGAWLAFVVCNGMTDAETEFTAELFKGLAGKHSLMVVEHDMGFVGSIADHVTVLHQGSVLAQGSLEQVQADERVVEVYLGR